MKKLVSLLGLAVLLAALPALAQDPGPDSIGMYFDTAGTISCNLSAPAYTNLTVYLIAKNINEPTGISGWECTLKTEPATLPAGINYTLLNNGLNVLSPPVFQVGLPAAVPYSANIVLATVSTFYLGGQILFGIGPCIPTSFPENIGPGIAAGDNPGHLIRLVPSSNVPAGTANTFWVAGVGAGPNCPVAIENDSWSGVKNLYE